MDLDPIRTRLVRRFGPEVNPWVDQVPTRATELADRWDLTLGEPYGNGNNSVVFRCGDVVLKLAYDVDFANEQATTLRLFAHTGRVPRVLHHEDGATVMEVVEPGEPVITPPPLDDFAELLVDLRTPATDGPRRLPEYTEQIFVRFEARGVDVGDARKIRDELVASETEQVLLHGDLHLYNVLNGLKLMAVDPKACLGDPCFDALDYAFQAKSADIAKAADLDVERVEAWWRAFSWMA
jgi:streptomycin 6-kinase